MNKGIVIAGFAGIGKTILEKKYENVIDLDCGNYKWIYENDKYKKMDLEKRKGIKNKIKNPEWPTNYVQEILEKQKKYKIITISLYDIYLDNDINFKKELEQNNIRYISCFPEKNEKKEYINRYKNRGNSNKWISGIEKNFENWIEKLQEETESKIVLSSKETLEDKLKQLNYI